LYGCAGRVGVASVTVDGVDVDVTAGVVSFPSADGSCTPLVSVAVDDCSVVAGTVEDGGGGGGG